MVYSISEPLFRSEQQGNHAIADRFRPGLCYHDFMSKLKTLTGKQQAFAQSIVDGLNQTDAYKAAGYRVVNKLPATVHQAASRLAADSKVVARIRELRDAVTAAVTEKRVWDTVHFIDEAETNLLQSRQLGQMAPANGALRLIGKTAGLLEPQPQATVQITKVTIVLDHGDGSETRETKELGPAVPIVEGKIVSDEGDL